MVRPVPDLPAEAGPAGRRPARPDGAGQLLPPLPARRAAGRGRRLPGDPPGERGPPAGAGRRRPDHRRARGTSSWTSSWCPARPSSGTSRRGSCRGSAFGGVMEVGYLPDMFGHVAQMPQLLDQAGLDHAVVWRGVPVRGRQLRVRVDGPRRVERPGRVPRRRLRQRGRPARGRQAARAPAGGLGRRSSPRSCPTVPRCCS